MSSDIYRYLKVGSAFVFVDLNEYQILIRIYLITFFVRKIKVLSGDTYILRLKPWGGGEKWRGMGLLVITIRRVETRTP